MSGFTYTEYRRIFAASLEHGYRVITLRDYFAGKFSDREKIVVNRVDIDVKVDRVPRLAAIYRELGVTGSFYVRLHAPAYNLLTFGNIAIVKMLLADGHEVGLHTELMDAKGVCGIDPACLLRSELALFESLFGEKAAGTASHGDMTPHNNLDFWKAHRPKDFGLLYEAYDAALWNNCRYVSDSEWTRWKVYEGGTLREGDHRDPVAHMEEGVTVLHLLTHPESWYDRYIYE